MRLLISVVTVVFRAIPVDYLLKRTALTVVLLSCVTFCVVVGCVLLGFAWVLYKNERVQRGYVVELCRHYLR